MTQFFNVLLHFAQPTIVTCSVSSDPKILVWILHSVLIPFILYLSLLFMKSRKKSLMGPVRKSYRRYRHNSKNVLLYFDELQFETKNNSVRLIFRKLSLTREMANFGHFWPIIVRYQITYRFFDNSDTAIVFSWSNYPKKDQKMKNKINFGGKFFFVSKGLNFDP